MEVKGPKSNLILKYCRLIYQVTEKKRPEEVSFDAIKAPLVYFQDFFGIPDDQACILLAFMIESVFRDQAITTETILAHFGNGLEVLSEIEQSSMLLQEKKYCVRKMARKRRSRFNADSGKKKFQLSELVTEAVLKGDKNLLKPEPIKGLIKFAQEVAYLTNQRWKEEINTDQLYEEIKDLMEQNQEIPFVNLITQFYLPPIELAVLWNICHRHIYYQREVLDVTEILSEIEDDSEKSFLFKRQLKAKKLLIQQHELIEFKREVFGHFNLVKPTSKLLKMLNDGDEDVKPSFEPQICRLEIHENIPEETLFFNHQEEQLLAELADVLAQDRLVQLQERLKQMGYPTGVNILLYGYAGTGKTASVKQWARKNQRNILWVEVNRIKSAWVGESEQNLQEVFDEYEQAVKAMPQTPILLFNEADAILGKRMDAKTGVDKMENAMQNILLQNLEDFNGIFIATTNMANQLDKAFDRRFLYKVGFQKPEPATRSKILMSNFPFLPEEQISMLNERFQLTGGQIMNVKKRLTFQEILYGKKPEYVTIKTFCEQELQFTNPAARPPIGFLQ